MLPLPTSVLLFSSLSFAQDADFDGLDAVAEAAAGTDAALWDTDGDGVSDGGESLVLYADPLNDDAKTCAWAEHVVANALSDPDHLALGDLDADGQVDVFASGSGTAAWYRNLGGGAFAGAQPIVVAGDVEAAVLVDVEPDGDLDLLTITNGGWAGTDDVAWYANLGAGVFGAANVVASGSPTVVQMADVDGDGLSDVVWADGAEVRWSRALGGGAFAVDAVLVSGVNDVLEVRLGDLDADGDQDLVVASSGDGGFTFANAGDGTFGPSVAVSTGTYAERLALADLDGDADLDIAWMGAGANGWHANGGWGAFGPSQALGLETGANPSLAVADFDGNGDLDAAAAVLPSSTDASWAPNHRWLGFADLRVIARGAAANSVAAADLTGDAVADLVIAWDDDSTVVAYESFLGDTDFDGLSNAAESCFTGTDPAVADSDGGGTSDGQELFDLTDPLAAGDDGPPADGDGDGLDNFIEVRIGTDPAAADSDSDGLLDPDEVQIWGTNPIDADTDADGLSDAEELLIHGSNPFNADSEGDLVGDGAEVAAGTNLFDPDTDADGLGDHDELTLYGSNPTVPDVADTDGDGLLDAIEPSLGTDPALADTDADGLDDEEELFVYATDPTDPDVDDDGLQDGDELGFGTDFFDADTDGDTLADGDEVNHGTNPADPDTDGDGFLDGAEAVRGSDPLVADVTDTDGDGLVDAEELWRGTDVFRADTEPDGYTDADEVAAGTDPLDWDTDHDGFSDGGEVFVLGSDPRHRDDARCAQWVLHDVPGDKDGGVYSGLAVADLDGDGDSDVLASRMSYKVVWYPNVGGTLQPPITVVNALGGEFIREVLAADLDADGDIDVVAREDDNWGNVYTAENLGGGVFAPDESIADVWDGFGFVMVAVDLDGDGLLDLLTPEHGLKNRGLGLAAGAGNWSERAWPADPLAAADLDGDGDQDILGRLGGLSRYENLGGGVMGPAVSLAPSVYGPQSATAADVDGDGDLDVLFVTSGGRVESIENLGGNTFGPPQLLGDGFVGSVGCTTLFTADLDLDGDPDIVVGSQGPDRTYDDRLTTGAIGYFMNLGGQFGRRELLARPNSQEIWDVQPGDMDGDGDLDVVSFHARGVSWSENPNGLVVVDADLDGLQIAAEECLGTDPTLADTDGGGTADGAEIYGLTDPFDPADDTLPADSDGDGVSDYQELSVFGTDPWL